MMFIRVFPSMIKSKLSFRLFILVMACSLFFALLASSVQLYFIYQRDVAAIYNSIKNIRNNHLLSLAHSVHNMDEEYLRIQLKALIQYDITYIKIKDTTNNLLVCEGNPDTPVDVRQVFFLPIKLPSGKKEITGTMEIYASFSGIYHRLWKNAYVILISTMIQTFLAAFVILLIIRFIITRHLISMAAYSRRLDANSLDETLKLNRKQTVFTQKDELDQVVNAINDLRSRLQNDILKRNKVEEVLRQKESKLIEAQKIACLGYCEMNPDNRTLSCSDEVYNIFEIDKTSAPALRETFLEKVHPSDREMVEKAFSESIKNKTQYNIDHRLLFNDDRIKFIHVKFRPEYLSDGKSIRSICTVQDITSLKQVEEELLEEKKFSDAIINALPDVFYVYELQEGLVRWNREYETRTGFSSEELYGSHFLVVPEGKDQEILKSTIKTIFKKGSAILEEQLYNKDGSKTPYIFSASLLERKNKKYIVGIGLNISAVKTTEKELRLTKYSIDNCTQAAYWVSRDGQFHYVNKTACLMTGHSCEDLMQMHVWDIDTKHTPELFYAIWQELEEKHSLVFESVFVTADDQLIPVEIHTTLHEFESEKYIFTWVQDITNRKKSEIEHMRLVSAIEQTNDNIIITDKDGNIEYVNPAFEKNTGYSREETYGRNPRILKSEKHDKAFYKYLWDTITNKQVWNGNIINRCKDGKLTEEAATIFPVLDTNGEILNYVAVKRDITEQRQMEDQLRQTQKLEAIGTLAGGIAHDFNNILSAVFSFTQLAQKKLPDIPEVKKVNSYLDKVFAAAGRAEDLIQQILTFSRKADFEPKNIDIAPLVKESIKFLKATIPSYINIDYKIDPDLKKIYGDPTQIHQIIMNLCTNASHAMEKSGGTLKLTVSNFHIMHRAVDTGNLEPGDYIMLTVSDTGSGMDEKTKKRLFEPFFTTKEKGKGTGLGLSVVHGIVKKHEGSIYVYSTHGIGTKFHVYLPVTAIDAAETAQEKILELPLGSESILLVDDEPDLTVAYGEILSMHGYNVYTTSSSLDALRKFTKNPENYDLIITDYTMPDISGIELAKEIHKLKQHIPIILISGLGELIPEKEIKAAKITSRYSKPLTLETLVNGVRDILNHKTDS